jgi:hypothetical protein
MATLSQLPDQVDLSFVAGDTFRIRVRVVDPTSGSAVPLSDYLFCAEIAQLPDRAVVAQFEVTPDMAPPVNTAVILTLPPSETSALPGMGNGQVFDGIWDLEVTFPNDDVRTVAKGTVNCVLDVSNSDTVMRASAGAPGTWVPSSAPMPASVAALQASAIAANPTTPWTSGQYVQTGTAGAAGEAHWDGTAWVAGRA